MPNDIYYFDEPTIGYCPACDKYAVYDDVRGLHCPSCETQELSLFKWDSSTKHPEEEDC